MQRLARGAGKGYQERRRVKRVKGLFLFIFLSALYFLPSALLYAQELPQYAGLVNDFAGVLDEGWEKKLTDLISALEERAMAEIAVVTVGSIAPYDEKQYAIALFDKWKVGKKGKDNGIIILLAVQERRWRIEVGYGLEGVLPDGLCGEIGRKYMVPYFKEGKFGEGLYNGVAQMASIISEGTLSAVPPDPQRGELPFPPAVFFFLIGYLVFLAARFIYISRMPPGKRRSFWGPVSYGGYSGGGSFGGGFGGFGGGGGGGGGAGGSW